MYGIINKNIFQRKIYFKKETERFAGTIGMFISHSLRFRKYGSDC